MTRAIAKNYIVGVDIAKIIAMFFVVGIHMVSNGFELRCTGGGSLI